MDLVKGIEHITKIPHMRKRAQELHREGRSIGFVPTMGYFHKGHLSLMDAARRETDYVIVSLFVNPIQFGPSEDYDRYPRDPERDIRLAEEAGVDIIFEPMMNEMYPEGFLTFVEVSGLSDVLCGRVRPGHFKGVATVVSKLFNIVRPDIAYFGQKDAQQVIIIKKMAEDLNMGITIKTMPIIREKDGLAMSSRNVYLSGPERKSALCLYRSLRGAEEMVKNGETKTARIIKEVEKTIKNEPLAEPEYIEICNTEDLSPLERIESQALLAIALRIGKTRLIDNTILKPHS